MDPFSPTHYNVVVLVKKKMDPLMFLPVTHFRKPQGYFSSLDGKREKVMLGGTGAAANGCIRKPCRSRWPSASQPEEASHRGYSRGRDLLKA